MENKYLAKTYKEKTIIQHTQDLLNQLNILKSIYPNLLNEEEWEILEYAIKYHDIGKINTKFQNKLYKKLKYVMNLNDTIKSEEIPHNYLSACFIDTDKFEEKFGREAAKILLSAVYYHHDREEKDITDEDVEDLIKQSRGLQNFFDIDLSKINNSFRRYILRPKDYEIMEGKKYILIKGLLNKLDYIASMDKRDVNIEEEIRQNGQTVSDIIKQITEEEYNGNYREVQKYMLDNKNDNLVVISYTGSGKTEAALLWADNSKTFYTLPLKVSINAMYNRIKNNIGYKKTLLLHSDAHSFYENEGEEINKYDRARRLSSPLIVTTVDQLFRIAFKYNGYEEILATLSYSKVIIDEIQMYSADLLAYIFIGLKMITDVGGKFAIVTATFPPMLYHIMDRLNIPYKKQEVDFKPHIMNRHKIELLEDGKFDYKKIRKLGKEKRVLIIANTVKRAQEIYENLKEENAYLLHSQYIKDDRSALEKKILECGQAEEGVGIWISTQIVEASLDIDFDVLFTELCTVDSLFQRMGRAFRKRLYNGEEPNVYIIDNKNGVPSVIDAEIYEYTLEEIKKYNHKNLSEADKQYIINNIFSFEKNPKLKDSNYYKQIKKYIETIKDLRVYDISRNNVSEMFRNISNVNLITDDIYNYLNNIGKIDEWNNIFKTANVPISEKIRAKDEIRKYVISVRNTKNVDKGKEELFYEGSNVYRTRYKYEFDSSTLKGRGMIRYETTNDNFDE